MSLDPYNEILPGLYLGGTPSSCDLQFEGNPSIFPGIDLICSFHRYSSPVIGGTIELRYYYEDDPNIGLDPNDAPKLAEVAAVALRQWKSGKNVLFRCSGGRNRSGLVLGLMLRMDGYSADDAIQLMRIKRDASVMHNEDFNQALRDWAL